MSALDWEKFKARADGRRERRAAAGTRDLAAGPRRLGSILMAAVLLAFLVYGAFALGPILGGALAVVVVVGALGLWKLMR